MKTRLFCFFVFIFNLFFCYGQTITQPHTKKIFILSSYHDTFIWEIGIEKGYKAYLLNGEYELYIEHLDSKRNFLDEEREVFLLDLYKKLYNNFKFDLILATDDPALEFIKNHYHELRFIRDIPILASGINKESSNYFPVIQPESIINEVIEADETILQIKSFFPNIENILIINDYTKTGVAWVEEISKQIESISDKVKGINFIYNEDIPFEDLLRQIELLPPQSAILVGAYFQDFNKVYYSSDKLFQSLASNSNLPIFCLVSDIMTEDVIGGKLNSGFVQGDMLGRQAIRLLDSQGEQSEYIDRNKDLSEWIFSYPALEKMNLTNVKLPPNSKILYEPLSFFEKNSIYFKFLFLFTSFLLVVAFVIMTTNIFLHRRVNRKTKELKNLIAKFEFFITEMPIGYIELDNQMNVLKWNKSVVDILGYREDEIIGKNIIDRLVSPDLVESARQVFQDVEIHNSISQTAQIKSKNGKPIDCVWYITKYYENNILSNYFCMVVDITENLRLRKNLENMLKRSIELMQNNDMFIASSIHDLKNLLTPILSYSELMMIENLPQEKIKSIAEQLNKSAYNLIEIFNETLNNSKMRGTFSKFSPQEFFIHEKVQNILLLAQSGSNQKNITVENQIDPNQKVFADPEIINSVIMNLFHNATKFTPQNGKIIFYGKKIFGDYYEVSVKDNGVGIDPEKFNDLFTNNKYFTTKGTESEIGTGLGLLLCHDLMMKNNGTIRAENNSGEAGATFSFALPVKQN